VPFRIDNFQENAKRLIKGTAKRKLLSACAEYRELSAPAKKTTAIMEIMELLDRIVPANQRNELMQSCGRKCLCDSTIKKAASLQKQATNIDDLAKFLNENRIGGGHLRREGKFILAEYLRCYCGSVSKTKTKFSPTYCQCSCGWYKQLFETIFNKPVKVELLGSIIQGDDKCRFRIDLK
jgi:hypothetical protein